jgi:hypothetical protein
MSTAYSSDSACTPSGLSDNTVHIPSDHMTYGLRDTWVLDEDGCIRTDGSKLVMSVPPDVRGALINPQCPVVISAQGSIKLDFSDAHIGDSWAQCYQPT